MINRLSDEWKRVESRVADEASEGSTEPDVQDVSEILQQIGGVREVLKKMCQVSVTRTTVRKAVRDALIPVLKEHKAELFPELAEIEALRKHLGRRSGGGFRLFGADAKVTDELRERIDAFEARVREIADLGSSVETTVEQLGGRIGDVDGHIQELRGRLQDSEGRANVTGSRLEAIQGRVESVEDGVAKTRGDLDAKVGEATTQWAARLEELSDRVDSDARLGDEFRSAAGERLDSIEDRLERSDERHDRTDERLGQINGRIGQVEGHVSRVELRLEEIETALRKEIDDMTQGLMEKFALVRDILARVESDMPHKDAVSTANERLQGLQERVETMAERVENIDSVTPQVRGLGTQFDDLRSRIGTLSTQVDRNGDNLGELEGEFRARLEQLTSLLSAGIDRWESDQSFALERLTVMRDTLRDQLHRVGEQVDDAQTSLLGRLVKRDAGVKMSRGEWETMAGKLEGIVAGLEGVLAKRREVASED